MSRKIPERLPSEFAGQITIGRELLDANNHVNNANYQPLYEQQRDLYAKEIGLDLDDIEKRLGLVTNMRRSHTEYIKPLLGGDTVTIYTAGYDMKSYLRFDQRIIKEGEEVNTFWTDLYVINLKGGMVRVPDFVREAIKNARFT